MFFSKEDTATLQTLGKLAVTAFTKQDRKQYESAHEALEKFLLMLKAKYPEKFKNESDDS